MTAWRPRFETRSLDGANVNPGTLRERLREDGYAILRGFLDPAIVSDAQLACELLQKKVRPPFLQLQTYLISAYASC